MIPLPGIGFAPARAALFLYSLLPIVRNTAAGLTDLPGPLRECAAALLAIAVQVLFDLAERRLLPRGLRRRA